MRTFVLLLMMGAVSAEARQLAPRSISEVEAYFSAPWFPQLPDFLADLSETTRASFVLMRQSQSLQPTDDPARPRVVLFGPDAGLVLAFGSEGRTLEMIESSASGFTFSRLELSPGTRPVKKTNCAGCHQGRPLWGQYRSWAGMYGGDQEQVPSGSAEEKDYLAFVGASSGHGLYGKLVWKCGTYYNGGIVPGFVPRGGAQACREPADLSRGLADPARYERRIGQPGEGLGEALNRWNVARLFERARGARNFPALARALAANTLGCFGERIYDYSADPAALARVRGLLQVKARPIEARISALAEGSGSREATLQGKLLNLLGVDVGRDLRLDQLGNGRGLGNDCDRFPDYSPNPFCRPGFYGYPAFSDGTDMASDLLGYLALRDLARADPLLRLQLLTGLRAAEAYFEKLPPGSGQGYDNVDYTLRTLRAVLADLERPDSSPAAVPTYLQEFAFAKLLRWGSAENVCEALLDGVRF